MADPRLLKDLNAIHPAPRGYVIWGNPPVEYEVRSVMDMKNKELAALFALDRSETERETMPETQIRFGKQILIVCKDFPPEELAQMNYQQTIEFHQACLGIGPPPLLQALTRLLDTRVPCEGACEHAECPYLHELWKVRDTMAEGGPPADPLAPATAAPTDSSMIPPPPPASSGGPTT